MTSVHSCLFQPIGQRAGQTDKHLHSGPRSVVAGVGAAALLALAGNVALAQTTPQKVSGPQARYWLNAETSTGLGAMMGGGAAGGGLGGIFAAMTGAAGGGGPSKSLRMDLGAVQDANPATGVHTIPAGMAMGASLPLLGPERAVYEKREREEYERETGVPEKPEGNMRILFFWGCGAEAGPGQPFIIDLREMMKNIPPLDARYANLEPEHHRPGYRRDRGYADWPNAKDSTPVPGSASLVGDHAVSSNIANEIRFSVPPANDYLGGLQLASSANPAGGTRLSWNNLERALGYAATSMGMKEVRPKETDMVMWVSSAQRRDNDQGLMGFLPPHVVQRLIGSRDVMPAGTTECVVSRQAIEAAGGRMFHTSLNAFGPEFNHIHPPRPQDPRVEWKQEYAVKLRTRSHTTIIEGMGGGAERSRPARADSQAQPTGQAQPAGQAPAPAEAEQKPALPNVGNILRGIFGR